MHLLGLPPFTVSYLPCHWTSKTVSWNHDSCPLKNEMPREILSQRNESSNRNFTVRSNRTKMWVGIFFRLALSFSPLDVEDWVLKPFFVCPLRNEL